MTFTEKIDVLELLLNLLEEHEQKLDSLVEQLEIVNQTMKQVPFSNNSLINEKMIFKDEHYKELLIVDDDENLVNTFKLILENTGFNVDVAYSGQRALNLLDQKAFDLVILDINLPDMLGYNIVEEMEMNGSPIEYIFITGYTALKTDLELKNEKREVLLKPITPERLIEVTTKYTSQISMKSNTGSPNNASNI